VPELVPDGVGLVEVALGASPFTKDQGVVDDVVGE
jgi:hypothetical protein